MRFTLISGPQEYWRVAGLVDRLAEDESTTFLFGDTGYDTVVRRGSDGSIQIDGHALPFSLETDSATSDPSKKEPESWEPNAQPYILSRPRRDLVET